MTAFFCLECIVKIISDGFVANGKKSYIRIPWNILDFIIVVASIVSLSSTEIDVSFIKSLRLLRILRPLRLISRNQGLKLAITTLANSMPNILNLLLIMQFFVFLIGILTTTLFAGKLNYCQTDHLTISLKQV